MKVLGIIPARFASTRFSGKPLVVIQGKTMIQRVFEQASKAESLAAVVVATDDERIFEHVKGFGGNVMMTSEHHQSGTDRCAEVVRNIENKSFEQNKTDYFDAVVNIQGDEPFIDPTQIDMVVDVLKNKNFGIATLVKLIQDDSMVHNPNIVKAVFSNSGRAIYFSRSPIPYWRTPPPSVSGWSTQGEFYKHIGLYAYRTDVLKQLAALSTGRLEQYESLEQLRWLENDYTIGVAKTEVETWGIDTPDDLLKLEKMSFETDKSK